MKLIFSPYFDNEAYLSRDCVLGEKTVGPMGLLAELELRTGTVGENLSAGERTAIYMNAIKKTGVKGRFFEDSFAIDELGVAAVLLQWRDMLIQAGWNKAIHGISQKLDDLADIEQEFSCPGIADRWRTLLEVLHDTSVILPRDLRIEVHMAKEYLEPVFQEILEAIGKKGCNVVYVEADKDALEKAVAAQKVNLLKFHDVYANYEWGASNAENYNLLIAGDPMMLNSYLHGADKPSVDAFSKDSNPSVIQLFKLGLSLFCRPLNIYNLLSYLTLPVHPVSAHLRRTLSEILLGEGGLGEAWTEAIDEYRYLKKKDDGTDEYEPDDKKTLERRIFIDMVDPRKNHTEEISRQEVQDYCTALRLWANGYSRIEGLDSQLSAQLETLKSFCSTLDIVLANADSLIEPSTFNSWIRFIYAPCTNVCETAEENSIDTVNDIRLLAEPAEKVLWIDCTGIATPHYGYEFLNEREKDRLKAEGIRLMNRETVSHADQYALNLGIERIGKKIDICVPVFNAEGLSEESPVVTAIRHAAEKSGHTSIITPIQTRKKDSCIALEGKKTEYRLSPIDTDALKREYESHSSLNQLIQFPFEYTMERYAKLKDRGIEEIGQVSTTEGNVAHKYIEVLFGKAGGDIDTFIKMHESDFDQLLDSIVEEKGAVLLLPENHFEYSKYRRTLKDTVLNLGKIIRNNNLSYVGSEVLYQPTDPVLKEIQARIDLVLKDSKGHINIIDLKWTRSKHRYPRLLESSGDQQLAIYKKAVEKSMPGTVVTAYGYFILSQGVLCIPDEYAKSFVDMSNINVVKRKDPAMTADAIFDTVLRSYRYRMEKIAQGHVEEAERMPLDNLEYAIETEREQLMPLDTDWEDKTLKSSAFGNPNRILKGDLR